MNDDDRWGFGRGHMNYRTGEWEGVEQKPFDYAFLGNKRIPLLHGEHPHSRQDRTTYALIGLDPYGFSGHRRKVKVVIESSNYLKTSDLSGDEVRRTCEGAIYVDDVQIEEFGGRDPEDVLLVAHRKLQAHFDGGVMGGLWDEEGMADRLGSLVYLGNTPAVVTRLLRDQASVWVEPANEAGEFPPAAWCIEEAMENGQDPLEEWRDHGYHDGQKIEIGSRDLWWHRKIPAPRDAELVAKTAEEPRPDNRREVLKHAGRLARALQGLAMRHDLKLRLSNGEDEIEIPGEGRWLSVLCDKEDPRG